MDHDAIPATLFYKGYRHSICTSINHVVCHGIPEERPLREGDIVNIDLTLIVDGWYGDSSRMYPVGEISRKAERLIEVTYESLYAGIAAAKPGNTTGDIGAAIQAHAEAERTIVVRDFVGHGVGQLFHDEPNIMHFGVPGTGVELKPGMIFTIEPMINLGRPHVKILSRRLDRGDARPHALGAGRALDRHHRDRHEIFTASPRGLFNPLAARE